MRKTVVILIVAGLLGIALIGCADDSYRMWITIRSPGYRDIQKKGMKYTSAEACEHCLLGMRELGIDTVIKGSAKDNFEILGLERIGNYGFTVYRRMPWGAIEETTWIFRCYPN